MTTQLGLFEKAKVEVKQPEPRTRVQVGTRIAQISLHKRRREALQRLMEVLDQLEGRDVYISTYGGAHNHFWLNNLKLGRLRVERFRGGDRIPSVVVLWGSRGASVRMFTNQADISPWSVGVNGVLAKAVPEVHQPYGIALVFLLSESLDSWKGGKANEARGGTAVLGKAQEKNERTCPYRLH